MMDDEELKQKVKIAVKQISINNWSKKYFQKNDDDYEYHYLATTENGITIKIVHKHEYLEGKYIKTRNYYSLYADDVSIISYFHSEEDHESYKSIKIMENGDKWLKDFTSGIDNGIFHNEKNIIESKKKDLFNRI